MCYRRGLQSHLLHLYNGPIPVEPLQGVVGGGWCHSNFPDLHEELQALTLSARHIRWLSVGVLVWTRWTIHNKLVITRPPLRRPTDAIYKLCGYLHLWKPLSRDPEWRHRRHHFCSLLPGAPLGASPPSTTTGAGLGGQRVLVCLYACMTVVCVLVSPYFYLLPCTLYRTLDVVACGCFIYKAGRKTFFDKLLTSYNFLIGFHRQVSHFTFIGRDGNYQCVHL